MKITVEEGQGRTAGMFIAKAVVDGQNYSSGFWDNRESAISHLKFMIERGFSVEHNSLCRGGQNG